MLYLFVVVKIETNLQKWNVLSFFLCVEIPKHFLSFVLNSVSFKYLFKLFTSIVVFLLNITNQNLVYIFKFFIMYLCNSAGN